MLRSHHDSARRIMMRSQHHHAVQKYYIKLFLADNCQNLKMAVIGRNMQFFLASKHHHLSIIYSCVFLTEFTSPYSLNAQRGWHTSGLHQAFVVTVSFACLEIFTKLYERVEQWNRRKILCGFIQERKDIVTEESIKQHLCS